MKIQDLPKHLVQSKEWGEVRTKTGTMAVHVGGVLLTLHKIPLINAYVGYAPKVNPDKIVWDKIKEEAVKHNCAFVRFDVPNIIKYPPEPSFDRLDKLTRQHCVKSPRDNFDKYNIFIDISNNPEEILANMKPKTRYNIRYARRKGVEIRTAETEEDFNAFWKLNKETAKRQNYKIHSKNYYKIAWEDLKKENMAEIFLAEYNGEVITAWFCAFYKNAAHYMYGGSAKDKQNLQASSLIAFEIIKMAKQRGCYLLDMWGGAKDPQDTGDPYYGFTRFKLSLGGRPVEHMDSYDLVINKPVYKIFNFLYEMYWKITEYARHSPN